MNDLFYVIKKANIYNYADDNSISYVHKSENVLKHTLQDEVNVVIKWLKYNYMRANPSKFQAFVIGKSKINNFNIVSAENNIVTI